MSSAQRQNQHHNMYLPLYGVKAHAQSRNSALIFMLCLFSIIVYTQLQDIKPLKFTGQKIEQTTIIMRTVPAQQFIEKKKLEKIIVDESEFTIIEPPTPKVVIPPKPIEKVEPVKPIKKVTPKKKVVPKKVVPTPIVEPKIETENVKPAEKNVSESVSSAAPINMRSTNEEADKQSTILGLLIQQIEKHKKYPRMARRRGIEGTIGLLITLDANGTIIDYRLGSGKGAPLLEKATLNLGKKIKGFATGVNMGKRIQINVPINYSLKN